MEINGDIVDQKMMQGVKIPFLTTQRRDERTDTADSGASRVRATAPALRIFSARSSSEKPGEA